LSNNNKNTKVLKSKNFRQLNNEGLPVAAIGWKFDASPANSHHDDMDI